MSIPVECDSCGRKYSLNERFAGRSLPCKECGEMFDVPDDGGDDDWEDFSEPRRSRSRSSAGGAPPPRARRRSAPERKSRPKPKPKRRKPARSSGGGGGAGIWGGIGGVVGGLAVLGLIMKFVVGGSTAQSEANIKELLAKMQELTSVMQTVTDGNSAQSALPKVQAICDHIAELKKKDEKNKIRKSQIEKLKKKYESQLTSVGMSLGMQVARLQTIPGAAPINQRVRTMLLNLR